MGKKTICTTHLILATNVIIVIIIAKVYKLKF